MSLSVIDNAKNLKNSIQMGVGDEKGVHSIMTPVKLTGRSLLD